jgi:NTP pyrophosphatase (non-canonical NTP hydrolase)
MDISEYQRLAAQTDRHPGNDRNAMDIPLLGLAGEVGTVLSQYKKYLRDGDAHELFKEKIAEELGDILWYLSNTATKFEIDLGAIARDNLAKVADRWSAADAERSPRFFDDEFPPKERLPRWFDAVFSEQTDERGKRRVVVTWNDRQIGDFLTDNAHSPDGYRFHDAFHFAYACILGWSPVTRRNLKLKRKSRKEIDEVEDGARAIIYEEAISGLVFEDARNHRYYETKRTLDYGLLDSIKRLTQHLEVRVRSRNEWEQAILRGFDVWRDLVKNGGGGVRYDLEQREMTYLGSTEGTASS